jgi:O-antigen/teichoic acid export membrane protein
MNIISSISETIELLKSRVAKDSAIVLTGNVLSAGIGFVATVLITRALGLAQFGLFSVAVTVMVVASQFSDFGVSTGLVRFASLYLQQDKSKADLMFKVSLKIRLIIAAIVFLIGFLVSGALATEVFGKPDLVSPLRLAFKAKTSLEEGLWETIE